MRFWAVQLPLTVAPRAFCGFGGWLPGSISHDLLWALFIIGIDVPLNLHPNLLSGEMRVMRICDLTVTASPTRYTRHLIQ